MLSIHNLTKKYPPAKTALKEIDFTLEPGLYGLLGPNGAGKSTLIHIITGSLAPTGGKICWNGKNTLRLGKKFRAILGYMPQQQNLYNSFTGEYFLSYMASLKEIPRKEIKSETQRVAALMNLTAEMPKKLGAYSGGMKQRLLAAAALLGDPQLVIMDEPTAGLDPKERVRLRETLASLAKTRIILVATHVVSDVEHVANEILLLKDGQLVKKHRPKY